MTEIPPEQKLYLNLRAITTWIEANSELPSLADNNAFTAFSVEIMNRTLYLLRVGVALRPKGPVDNGMPKNRAILLGHLVRLMKLYECFLTHACENQMEICMIFLRLMLETAVRLEYLMKARQSSFRSFVLTSYRPERESIVDLRNKGRARPLSPIERRMLRSMTEHLRRDRITEKALLHNRNWDLDGKNFRRLLNDAGYSDWGYSYGFGNGSHFVHGDWRDLTMHHLRRRHGRYFPNPGYRTMDARPASAAIWISLRALIQYLRWNRSDPDNFVRPIVAQLMEFSQRFDDAHETYIQQNA